MGNCFLENQKEKLASSDGTIGRDPVTRLYQSLVSYFLLPLYEGLAAAGIRLVDNNSTREDHVTEMYKTKADGGIPSGGRRRGLISRSQTMKSTF